MFSLANGKLFQINADGTEGEPFQTTKSFATIGTTTQSDCRIDTAAAGHFVFEIYKDDFGNVSAVSTEYILVRQYALATPFCDAHSSYFFAILFTGHNTK